MNKQKKGKIDCGYDYEGDSATAADDDDDDSDKNNLGCGRQLLWPDLRHFTFIFAWRTEENRRKFHQIGHFPG